MMKMDARVAHIVGKGRLLVASAGVAAVAMSASAAGVADEIDAARAEIASNSVTRKTGCRYYITIRYTGPDVEHKRRPMIHYVVIRK